MKKTLRKPIAAYGILLFAFTLFFVGCQKKDKIQPEENKKEFKKPETTSIIGGNPISIDNRSYQVLIDVGTGYGGGVILNNEWILTAAHVVTQLGTKDPVSLSNIVVYSGSSAPYGGNISYVNQVIIHEGFPINDGLVKPNDIALLKLSAPLTFSTNQSSIIYSNPSDLLSVNDIVSVSGWGRTACTIPGPSPTLNVTNVLVNSLNDPSLLSCVSPSGTNQQSWMGDSGGPIVKSVPGLGEVLFGIVSGGTCPGGMVYSRVSYFADWIKTKTGGLDRPTLEGPSSFCTSATYSISNLPAGATVSWSLSGTGLASISPGGSTAMLTRTGYGAANLIATVSLNGHSMAITKPIVLGYKQPTVTVNGGNTWGGSKFYIIGNTEPGTSYRLEVTTPSGTVYTAFGEVSLDQLGKYWVRLYITNNCVTERLVYTSSFISVDDGGPIH